MLMDDPKKALGIINLFGIDMVFEERLQALRPPEVEYQYNHPTAKENQMLRMIKEQY